MAGFLSPERLVAGPRFHRAWIVVAALLINLSVGQAYAWSVFNLPLARALGVREPAAGDWTLPALGIVFTLAYVFLGLSAGVFGAWQDRVGPRVSGIVAASCFGAGFFLAAAGVHRHEISLLYLGYGVLGGCGLGLGFNTPIPVLLRWFPERKGLAAGLAIMGFGGGAILAAPLSTALMRRFASDTSVGVVETLVALGVLYTLAMLAGAFLFRLPSREIPPALAARAASPAQGLTARQAMRTRAFFLLWVMLLLNVTAGLGVLGQAAAMLQDVFDGASAEAAGFFVALLSFFNMGGRLAWAWLSDRLGRPATYALFFSLGPVLYAAVPLAGQVPSLALFVGCFALIMSMYGGAFATLPAYVADLFGSAHVGAIYGRLLTALSVAGLLGPTLLNTLRERWIAEGHSRSHAYDASLYIMAGLLVVGFLCNRAIPPPGSSAHLEGSGSARGPADPTEVGGNAS
jgi:MFS family permease